MSKNDFFFPRWRCAILPFAGLLFIALAFSSCDDEDGSRDWQLVWADEFNGPAGEGIDTTVWNFDIGAGCDTEAGCGWGNNELQFYTDRPENVAQDGEGNLVITARAESFEGFGYTSGRITTKNLFAQQYGRFEARIQMPWGRGLWPAFWMLGANIDEVSWPQCGEIDIVEFRGQEPNKIHGSVHGPGYSGGNPVTFTYTAPNDRYDTDFHVFAVEWGEGQIDYYVDDLLYFTIEEDMVPGEWVYDQPFYLLLNLAVGGNFVGAPNASTPFPQSMLVDYVRVYQ